MTGRKFEVAPELQVHVTKLLRMPRVEEQPQIFRLAALAQDDSGFWFVELLNRCWLACSLLGCLFELVLNDRRSISKVDLGLPKNGRATEQNSKLLAKKVRWRNTGVSQSDSNSPMQADDQKDWLMVRER